MKNINLKTIVATAGINAAITQHEEFNDFVKSSLIRHVSGDWGDLSQEDAKQNDESESYFFSSYKYRGAKFPEAEEKIWIITDSEATTILWPSEY